MTSTTTPTIVGIINDINAAAIATTAPRTGAGNPTPFERALERARAALGAPGDESIYDVIEFHAIAAGVELSGEVARRCATRRATRRATVLANLADQVDVIDCIAWCAYSDVELENPDIEAWEIGEATDEWTIDNVSVAEFRREFPTATIRGTTAWLANHDDLENAYEMYRVR